jgi:hypothetical protein
MHRELFEPSVLQFERLGLRIATLTSHFVLVLLGHC